jgi:cytochrome P450
MSDMPKGELSDRAGQCPVFEGYDPHAPSELSDPFPSYARARSSVPVFYSEAEGFWSVARREDVLEVLRDTQRFSSRNSIPMPLPPSEFRDRMPRYPFATALAFLDGPAHHSARKLVQAPFTPRRLQQIEPILRNHAVQMLRPEDPDRYLEFVNDYAFPVALVVIGDIIGVPARDFPLLRRSIEGAFRLASGSLREDEVADLARGQLEYWEYLCALVEERRIRPRDDFTSVLASHVSADECEPSNGEIAAHINTVLGAGFETSAQMMAFGVKALLEHQDQWELLQRDRTLMSTAVEECVRYRSVVKRTFRVTTEDVEINGVRIPEGALVALLHASANRDAVAFPEPDRFDISRKADNLTFGRGTHFCLGAPLSKMEMRVTLETLIDLAPDARFADMNIAYKPDIRVDAMEALHLDLGEVPTRGKSGVRGLTRAGAGDRRSLARPRDS